MLAIVGVAVLILDLALCLALLQGKAPAAVKGAVGWTLSGLLAVGAVGLEVVGLPQLLQSAETDDTQVADSREDTTSKGVPSISTSEKKNSAGRPGGGKKAGSKRGGNRKEGSKTGRSRKGSGKKRGGKKGGKKGGWSRRKRAPVVPLTPEREKQMLALRSIGAESVSYTHLTLPTKA